MSQTGLKTGDLNLELQGQISLKTIKFFVIFVRFLVSATTFEPWNFTFKLEVCIDHLKVLHYFKTL